MILEVRADGLEGARHMVADGIFGDAEAVGDLFMGQALVAAEEVDGLLLCREAVDGLSDELFGFLFEELLFGRGVGVFEIFGDLLLVGCMGSEFPEFGEDMVSGDDEEIVFKAFYGGEPVFFFPDLGEYLLDHVFGHGFGFGEHEGDAVYIVPVLVKELAEGGFVAGGYAFEEGFFCCLFVWVWGWGHW